MTQKITQKLLQDLRFFFQKQHFYIEFFNMNFQWRVRSENSQKSENFRLSALRTKAERNLRLSRQIWKFSKESLSAESLLKMSGRISASGIGPFIKDFINFCCPFVPKQYTFSGTKGTLQCFILYPKDFFI